MYTLAKFTLAKFIEKKKEDLDKKESGKTVCIFKSY